MSEHNTPPEAFGNSDVPGSSIPPPPPPPPPLGPPTPRPRSGGSIVLGLVIGLGGMASLFGLASVVTGQLSAPQWLADLISGLAGVAPFGLIVLGIVLSALEKTRRTGAGILLSFGVAVLIAGGLCVALLVGLNTIP